MASKINLALIPGDGIGVDVVAEGVKVLKAVPGVEVTTTEYDLGAKRYNLTGDLLPDSVVEESQSSSRSSTQSHRPKALRHDRKWTFERPFQPTGNQGSRSVIEFLDTTASKVRIVGQRIGNSILDPSAGFSYQLIVK